MISRAPFFVLVLVFLAGCSEESVGVSHGAVSTSFSSSSVRLAIPEGSTTGHSGEWTDEAAGGTLPADDKARRITVLLRCAGTSGGTATVALGNAEPKKVSLQCSQGAQEELVVPPGEVLSVSMVRSANDGPAQFAIGFREQH